MEKLDVLKFELNEKIDELGRLRFDTFTFNPRVNELAKEITSLQEQIKEIEEDMNNAE